MIKIIKLNKSLQTDDAEIKMNRAHTERGEAEKPLNAAH